MVSLAADPGFTNSNLQKESARLNPGNRASRVFARIVPVIGMSTARGALPQLRAATDPQAGGGELYTPRWVNVGPPVRRPISSRSRGREEIELLWDVSERETGATFDVPRLVEGLGAV